MLLTKIGNRLCLAPFPLALCAVAFTLLLTGCGSTPAKAPRQAAVTSVPPPVVSGAVPRVEPIRAANTRPYTVFGRTYFPMSDFVPYEEEGIASWYGREFHGKPTATGERYDMFAMTAAHKTLPLPSYARVTSLTTGRQVIVRVNDRGPFVGDRIIDLSFAAADALGIANQGTAPVRVSLILPEEIRAAEREGRSLLAAAPLPAADGVVQKHASAGERQQSLTLSAQGSIATARATEIREEGGRAVASPVALSASEPETATSGRFFLQLGAFSVAENAENFAVHLRVALPDVALKVVRHGQLVRVVAGPYRDETVATLIAEQLLARLGHSPLVVRAETLGGLP